MKAESGERERFSTVPICRVRYTDTLFRSTPQGYPCLTGQELPVPPCQKAVQLHGRTMTEVRKLLLVSIGLLFCRYA